MKKLMEDLIEEILLRLPPNEPAYFVCTALVCKLWCRILSDRDFHRRYRAFHRTPPLLGYLHNLFYEPSIPRFVPTSTTVAPFITPLPLGPSESWRAFDCRHGRVLLVRILGNPNAAHLVVWDPVTGEQHPLSMPVYPNGEFYNGAVLCAADGCDHLDCHGSPFIVVFVVSGVDHVVRASMYSSENRPWGAPSSVDVHIRNSVDHNRPSLLAQGALHFNLMCGGGQSVVIKYDLRGHSLSVIDKPAGGFTDMVMVKSEDGVLGFVAVSDGCVYLWTRQQAGGSGANGATGGWVRHKAAEIKTLLPPELGGYRSKPRDVIGFAESTGTIFINRTAGVFAVDLKSRQARMVGERGPYPAILPFMSFYTPDIAKGRLTPP